MIRNIVTLDRLIRVALGLALLTFALAGDHVAWWGWFGLIPLATAFPAFCPLYRALHLSTVRKPAS